MLPTRSRQDDALEADDPGSGVGADDASAQKRGGTRKTTRGRAKLRRVGDDDRNGRVEPSATAQGREADAVETADRPVDPLTDPDTQRMLAFQDGDEAAFTALFNTHLPAVVGTFMRYCRDRQVAEDLAQEAFLRVYRARDRYEPRAKFTTWLYRIVTNLALNWSRDAPKRQHRSLSGTGAVSTGSMTIVEAIDQGASEPDSRMDRDELADVMATAIDALPETQRMALILNKYQQQSYQEIADAMSLTTKAVKSLLARARDNLKERLSPYWARVHREAP